MLFKIGIIGFILGLTTLAFGFGGGGSIIDPYIMPEPGPTVSTPTVKSAIGRTQFSSVYNATTAVIVTLGQSNIISSAGGTFTAVNATAQNLNPYDGGTYSCRNPALGTAYEPALGNNSANCQIADSLITNGIFTRVVMIPIGIGGTSVAQWAIGGEFNQRIVVTMKRLAAIGVLPTYVLWHQGEADAFSGTPGATYTTAVKSVAQTFRDYNYTGPFFVAIETLVNNVTYPIIQTAQANAVDGILHIVAGANWDSLTGGTNRADGTHFTQTGAANAAALDVTIITNCKMSNC